MSDPVDFSKQKLFRVSLESLFSVQLAFHQWTFRMTPARLVLLALAAAAVAILLLRLVVGLGPVTNLCDAWPWGIWKSFSVFTGIALAGGGYATALIVHILHDDRLKPIARAAMLSSLIGYILAVTALFAEIGRWWNFWPPFLYWGYESIMFEVFVCITLYTIVQVAEMCEVITEKVFRIFHRFFVIIMPFLLILGVVLPTLHQSSLGALYLMMDGKLHGLWFSPYIFAFFLLSSFYVGPAMIALASLLTQVAYKHVTPLPALRTFARIGGWVMLVYLILRFADLAYHGRLPLLLEGSFESYAFILEIVIGLVLPLLIVFSPLVNYRSFIILFGILAVLGLILNRSNVVITGMWTSAGSVYIPAVTEILLTVGLVTGGILVYMFFCENFDILGDGSHEQAA